MTAAIRALHRREPRWNWCIALFYGVWLGSAALAIAVPSLPVRLAAWFLAGAALQALGILMHEGVHYLLSRDRRVNRLLALAAGLPTLLSVTAYRTGHLPHHRHERDAHDPDELENFTRDPRTLSVLLVLTLLGGELFGWWRVGPWNALRVTGRERRDIVVDYLVIGVVAALAIAALPFAWLLHGWILPAVFACRLTNVRTLAEHALTARANRGSVTRTVLSNSFVSLFMCNLNYHAAHHRYPGVPWYHLPRLHALLAPELERDGSPVYRSYTRFLTELAAFVLRAFGPDGRALALALPPRRSACVPS